MPTYITLLNWTDQGIKNYKETTKRAEAAGEALEKIGAKLTSMLLVGILGLVLLFGGCMALVRAVGTTEPAAVGTRTPTPSHTPTPSTTRKPGSTPTPSHPQTRTTPDGVPAGAQTVAVHRIVDGDTLEVAALASGAALASTVQVDVRLLEIDTPETKDPTEPVQCYGAQATRALERLLPPGSRAWVQRDEELRDRYGRYLLYAWNADGVFVNLRMVQRGYARAMLYEPNDRHWNRISAAERNARPAGRGLWEACPRFGAPANPPAPPGQPPGGGGYPVPPPPPDRDCSEISDTDFRVRPGDPHRFDRDGDGIGCES